VNQIGGIISATPSDLLSEEAEELLAEPELRQALVDSSLHGSRLDRALVACVPEFSRSYLQQLLEAGAVTVNGLPATKAAHKVRAGDQLTVELRPTQQSQAFKPEALPLQIVFEDEHLLVINKAAGMVVHPAPGNWTGTLLNALLAHHPVHASVPRAGIVHRLDKDTSGLMVVARHREAMDALVQAIAARTVSRQYLALAHGAWGGPSQRSVTSPIGRDPRNRLRMAVVDLGQHAGKAARTDIICLASLAQGCFVRCILHTGRTHQIRVHMASLGHPLLADSVYGGRPEQGLHRQALHATHLSFTHPLTGRPLVFEAPLPQDMREALAGWGLRYNPAQASQLP
jgi:23S rRNA pseudouridine1911/1915/1917 synthase